LDNKKEKRELIIQAAISIFAKEGFHGARISDIAIAAGIGKGTIYEYFKSKTQLFEEMIKYTLEIYIANIELISQGRTSTQERLKRFVELAIEIARQHMDIGRIYIQETGLVGENIIHIMLSTQKRILEMIEGVIQKGVELEELRPVDTRIAALSFIGGLKHLTMYYFFIYKRSLDEEEINKYVDLYISGLKK